MTDPSIFTVGGTVQAGGGLYLPRPADDELLQHCLDGNFCYVLTARQMGKSSLMVRTAETLQTRGVRTVIMDLTRLGTTLAPEQWYLGLVDELVEQLDLMVDYKTWWQTHSHLGPTQRLSRFLRDVVLKEISATLVIFIDEIDTTLSLVFADDFFAAIRACYNARGTDPAYKRLSFVLLGVATPSDLIRDSQRTPFNIGTRIDLTDFTLEQALPLADGLNLAPEVAQQTLAWVLDWTGGHPYLTQRLCRVMLERPRSEWGKAAVAQMVEETFFGERSKQDGNLQFVSDMLTRRAPEGYQLIILQLLRDLQRGRKVKDDEQAIPKMHLKLAGLVRRKGDYLLLRNKIYSHIFDQRWLSQNWPISWRRQSTLITVVMLLVLVLGIGATRLYDALTAPSIMTGDFRIAVAEFSQVGESQPGVASIVSQQIFQYLDDQANRNNSGNIQVQVSHKNIGVIMNGQEAKALAERIHADVVIYGDVSSIDDQIQFTLRLYVADVFRGDVSELNGEQKLSAPITLPIKDLLTPGNRLLVLNHNGVVILTQFMIALAYLEIYDPYLDNQINSIQLSSAMEAINQAIQYSKLQASFDGQEVLYLFASKIARLQGKYDSAQEFLDYALKLNPNYGRGYIEQADIYYDQGNFFQAKAFYEKAKAMPDQPFDAYIIEQARFGIGNIYRVELHNQTIPSRAETYKLSKQALENYQIVIDSLGEQSDLGPHLQEITALAYYYSGTIYQEQGQTQTAEQMYRKALAMNTLKGFLPTIQASLTEVK